jgi:BMFP domain-containing protein YqiC
MDHATYLERHHELTNTALAALHNLMAEDDFEAATDVLATTRAQIDTLWEQRLEGVPGGNP